MKQAPKMLTQKAGAAGKKQMIKAKRVGVAVKQAVPVRRVLGVRAAGVKSK